MAATPMSADPEMSRFPERAVGGTGFDGRPALLHTQTEPIQSQNLSLMVSEPNSPNRMSLIDLDLGLPEAPRPSTANSDVGSSTSESLATTNPFDLERHASLYRPESMIDLDAAEPPPMFVSNPNALAGINTIIPPFIDPERERSVMTSKMNGATSAPAITTPNLMAPPMLVPDYSDSEASNYSDMETPSTVRGGGPLSGRTTKTTLESFDMSYFPDLPAPPSEAALTGTADRKEMLSEFERMFSGLEAQLGAFKDVYSTLPTRRGPIPDRR